MPETLSVRLSVEERAAVDRLAALAGCGPSALVRRWVRERALESVPGQGLSTGEVAADELVSVPSRASDGRSSPSELQLANRAGVPVALARRWLVSGEWREHWS